jgi:regulator of protease activity HflC (stomatin/prohibitin superfamily)
LIKRFLAIAAVAMMVAACERIDTGNTGIEVGATGQVSKTTLGQGLYFTPFRTIYEVSGKEDTIQMNDLHPKSRDNLTMEDLDVDITIQVDASKAAEIYTRFSNDLHYHKDISAYVVGTNYVTRQARAVIYRVIAAHEAITMHQIRQKLESEIEEALQKELNHDMGPNWIVVRNVNIRNLVTDKRVEDSIREIAATQFKTTQVIEAQKQAEAEATRLRIETEGKANASAAQRLIEAQAIAKANELITKSITPEVLKYREIEALRAFADKGGTSTVLIPQGLNATPLISTGK